MTEYIKSRLAKSSAFAGCFTLAILSSLPVDVQAHQLTSWKSEIAKADRLKKEGKDKEAFAALFKAYADLKGATHARDHHQEEFVKTVVALAKSYREAADYSREYQTWNLLADFYKHKGKTDCLDYAECLFQLSINCDRRKDYARGAEVLEEAAAIYRKNKHVSKVRIARVERGLGHFYTEVGDFKRAEAELSAAIELSNRFVDASTHNLGKALLTKGKLFQKQGKYKAAISNYREAVDVFRNNLRRGHLWISYALGDYAGLLKKIIYDLNRAEAEGDTTWNKENLLVALAQAQLLNNSFFDAKKTLEYLKVHYEKHQLTSRVGYARCLELLGECCLLLEDFKDGIKYQKQAVELYGTELKDQKSTADALVTLSHLQHRMDLKEESNSSLSRAEAIIEKMYGKQSIEFGECLQLKVSWLLKDGKIKEMEPVLQELAKIYPDKNVPEKLVDEKSVKEMLLELSYLNDDHFHTELWHDWERSLVK